MDNKQASTEILIQKVEEFGKSSIEILKLKAVNKTTHVFTTVLFRITQLILLSLTITLFNIGIALWLGEVLGKTYYGFLAVACFYAIVSFIVNSGISMYLKIAIKSFVINLLLDQKPSI